MQRPSPFAWQAELAVALKSAGASLIGFADLGCLPAEARGGFPRALSLGVALNAAVVAGLSAGPTLAYHAEYERVNALLATLSDQAARAIEARGFAAATGPVTVKRVEGDGATALPHKTVATRAGLGWIGDCALLITPGFGSAVRLASVLTDAPLLCDQPLSDSRCGACRACVDACPAGAVVGELWREGLARERMLDVASCKRVASALAAAQGIDVTICGICVLACPWTQRYLRRQGATAASARRAGG